MDISEWDVNLAICTGLLDLVITGLYKLETRELDFSTE